MVRSRMVRLVAALLCALAVGITACSESKTANDAASGGPHDDVVAGRIGGKKVTVGEIDTWIKDQLFKQATRGRNALKVYEVRTRALEQMASEKALDQEATKTGKDRDTLLKDEAEKRATVSDEAVQKHYDEHKDRFRDMPFERVSPVIKRQLLAQHQAAARQNYVGDLRQTFGYENQLEPPRFEMVVGTSPALGAANAAITLVEFSDYECPFCKSAESVLKQVIERYPTQLRVVAKNFPLALHPRAKPAAEAAMCAAEQNRFWEYHTKLFEKAPKIDAEQLALIAEEVGLDNAKFEECLISHRTAPIVQADLDAGEKAGVSGTPAFFVNGVPLAGGQSLSDFATLIDAELVRLKLPVPLPPTERTMPLGQP